MQKGGGIDCEGEVLIPKRGDLDTQLKKEVLILKKGEVLIPKRGGSDTHFKKGGALILKYGLLIPNGEDVETPKVV